MPRITAEAPMRIDFAGGTIDLPPLYLFHHPAPTVNAGVNIKGRVTIESAEKLTIASQDQKVETTWDSWEQVDWTNQPMLELAGRLVKAFQCPPARIEIHSEAPAGSGLGGSSTLAITLTAALAEFTSKKLSKQQIIEFAKSIETQTIKVPTGYQDYWGAVYGGLHAYQIELDGELTVQPLGSDDFRQQLQAHLMLVYVGKPHFSGVNNWELFRQHIDQVNGVPVFFEQLKENGVAMRQALLDEDLVAVARVLNEDWQVRKSMLPDMTTDEIEKLTEEAMKVGCEAARVCGAGAGGCVLMLVDPAKRKAVRAVVDKLGMRELDSTIAPGGVTVSRS